MKKLLSVLLTLSMLLTLLIVPISAGGTEPTVGATLTENCTSGRKLIKGTDTTFNGATVIYDLADFAGITSGNYILANDIEVGTVTGSLVTTSDDFTLDGNGYSFDGVIITNDSTGLIMPCVGKTTTVKNLGLEVESAILGINQGVLFGCTGTDLTDITLVVTNVSLNGSLTQNGAATGGFIGRFQSGTGTFTNCTATGNWDFTFAGVQGAGFVGLCQANTLTFNYCVVDANVVSNNNRKAGFVGQVNAATQLTFNHCSASGFYCEEGGKWLSPYLAASNNASAVVNYISCTNDAVIIGYHINGAYYGADQKDTTLNFNGCSFTGAVVGRTTAGAFLGQAKTTKITYENCTVGGVVVTEGTVVSAKNVTGITYSAGDNGEISSATVQQKTAVLEAAGVTKTTKGNYYYSKDKSIVGLQTLAAETKAYYQTKDAGENLKDVRILISVPEAGVASVKGIDIEVTFGLTAGGVKTLTVNDKDEKLASYYSVIADSKIAEAGEGYVLLAVVVTGVDTTAWNGTIQVEMTATDENGTAVDGFQITPAGDAVNGNPTT